MEYVEFGELDSVSLNIRDIPLFNEKFVENQFESIHEGKKSYECEHCHKGFDGEENFKRLIESVHEGKKPYECEQCHEGFD